MTKYSKSSAIYSDLIDIIEEYPEEVNVILDEVINVLNVDQLNVIEDMIVNKYGNDQSVKCSKNS